MRTLLVAFALALSAPALAGRPTPPALPTEHADDFASGDVVLVDDPNDGDAMYAYLSIDAPRDKVWEALNNPALIESSSSTITQCKPYQDETASAVRTIKLHYILSVAWSEVTYYIHRQHHIGENYLEWTLDRDKQSDILVADGYYVLEEPSPGKTHLIYWSKSVSGRKVPAWIRDMLTGRALKGWLDTVKSTSEGA
ncbi:MAG: hypothetical protein EP330_17545 [Deltaproteobacteria bacterium]|nr:MAG: hypothetical protein EP330_17545 [Deltaproteobacteria bacterium]